MAKKQFEKANSIQSGVAAFNLACVHGIKGENDECLEALKIAKDKGNLPEDANILSDPDLAGVVKQKWFKDFMASLEEDRRIEAEKLKADKLAAEEAKKPKPKDPNVFDPYAEMRKKTKTDETKTEATDNEEIEPSESDETEETDKKPTKKSGKKA